MRRDDQAGPRVTAPGMALIAALAAGGVASAHGVDMTRLPLGDGRTTTTTPQRDYVYVCTAPTGQGGGAFANGPWIGATTWDFTTKVTVDGAVTWPNALFTVLPTTTTRVLTGNDLPSTTTGVFPIASGSTAYQYDRNPNTIKAQSVAVTVPAAPDVATKPSCLSGGAIGMFLNGAQVFNALDAPGRDAPAHEVLDKCDGHPEVSGAYHHHMLSRCMAIGDPKGSSPLIGYALDGFGIYGPYENGQYLANEDLDLCHGRTSAVTWNGTTIVMYHYVANWEYPYTLGCYRGTPTVAARASATQVVVPETGWWWNADEGGRGYAIEVANGRMMVAAYLYRADGTPVWYVGYGTASGSTYAIDLSEYRGSQTLDDAGPANAVAQAAATSVTLTFTGPASGTIAWKGGATTTITRYPFSAAAVVAPDLTAAPQTGWWWNANEPGTGYFIEAQGPRIFLAAYLYGADQSDRWYYALGAYGAATTGVSAATTLIEAGSGQTLTSGPKPSITTTDRGALSLTCSSNTECVVTLPSRRAVTLSRFKNF